jgi:hypothetical protein
MALARARLLAPRKLMAGQVLPRLMGCGWGRVELQRWAGTALPTEAFWASSRLGLAKPGFEDWWPLARF